MMTVTCHFQQTRKVQWMERQPRSPCHSFLVPLSHLRPTNKKVNDTALMKTRQHMCMCFLLESHRFKIKTTYLDDLFL